MGVGTDGDDTLSGGIGNETLDGGAGNDTASYATAATGVVADLTTGVVAYETRIMPLGDSITYGIASTDAGGYRGPLWDRLLAHNAVVNAVGSQVGGLINDPDNEGHPGWTIEQLDAQVSGWLAAAHPDVVLLIAGTNNTSGTPLPTAQDIAAKLSHLIDDIAAQPNPPKLFIGPIPPMNDAQGADRIALAQAYDALIPGLIDQKHAAGIDVTYVDMSDLTPADITPPPLDPGLHPTPAGYDKIAADWYTALANLPTDHGTFSGTPRDQLVSIENLQGSPYQDALTGDAGPNMLTGLAGADTLDGGLGADTLTGGVGNDVYVVDNPGDQVIELTGEGNDTVKTTLSSYTLGPNVEKLIYVGSGDFSGTGNELVNTLTGGPGNDTLDGGAGKDVLYGGAGDDRMVGGLDADRMEGGPGNDVYVVDTSADAVIEQPGGGNDTVEAGRNYVLPANVENVILTGTSSLTATGNSLANTLTGNIGNNTIDGGSGADVMIGMAGKDTYIVDDLGDVVSEVDPSTGADAGGYDTVKTTLSAYTLPKYVEVLATLNTDPNVGFQGTGNELSNVIIGGPGADTLSGGQDSVKDSLQGGAGDDTYIVMPGDVIVEDPGAGHDRALTASNVYAATANVEDVVFTGVGPFQVKGNELNNLIVGGAGNDVLDGGLGADTLQGGAGDDTYVVDDPGDVVMERDPASGADTGGLDQVKTTLSAYTLDPNVEKLTYTGTGAFAGNGNELDNTVNGGPLGDTLHGGAGNDNLKGGDGGDYLFGDDGKDKLSGDNGADTLCGGAGTDQLTGGQGADQFLFTNADASSKDFIADFTQGEDKIGIVASGFDQSLAPGALDPAWFAVGSSATAAGHGQFVFNSSTNVLSWDPDGNGPAAAVAIAAFSTPVSLQASDFVLV